LVAENLVDLARNQAARKDYATAESLAREGLAIYQKQEAHTASALRAYFALQLSLQQQQKYTEAERVAKQALALARGLGAEEHPEVANILHNYVHVKINLGDPAGGEELAR